MFKIGLSPSKIILFVCFNERPLKMIIFLFHLKSSALCPDLFSHVLKHLDKKTKVNLQIYDIAIWETSNCNTCIAQYLKKERQSDGKTWFVNEI